MHYGPLWCGARGRAGCSVASVIQNLMRGLGNLRGQRTHVGKAAPAVQGQGCLEAEHGRLCQQGPLGRMGRMVGPLSHAGRLVLLCPCQLLQVHLEVAGLQCCRGCCGDHGDEIADPPERTT